LPIEVASRWELNLKLAAVDVKLARKRLLRLKIATPRHMKLANSRRPGVNNTPAIADRSLVRAAAIATGNGLIKSAQAKHYFNLVVPIFCHVQASSMTSKQAIKGDVPNDVYVQFVTSLFANAHILLIGGATYFLVALMVYLQTSVVAFLLMAPILALANLWRYLGIRAFQKLDHPLSFEEAQKWEQDYITRGIGQGLAVSLFGFLSIYLYPSSFAEIASVSMAIASLVTVATRNYGSKRMVRILSFSFIGPAALAFLLRGDMAYGLLGFMILPMLFITISTAGSVRRVLFDAIIGEKRADMIAERFDRALNTMPQGLLMLDTAGRVVVANTEAAQLTGLSSPARMTKRTFSSLMQRVVAGGLLNKEQCREVTQRLINALHEGFDLKLVLPLTDGRSFEFSTREGDNNLGVVMFEDVTQRERAARRITTMARFDSLTGLANRSRFRELTEERLKAGYSGRNCALIVLDLDDFKAINDSLGNPAGDQVIRAIGQRLLPFSSENIIVGRLGSDEFVVYLDDIKDAQTLGSFIDSLCLRMSEEVEVANSRLSIQVSVGAVLMDVRDASVDLMTVRADLALQDAKTRGKDGWSLFEDSMEQSFRLRQAMKVDLRAAIKARKLRVVYQPILSLGSLKVASCEALCRWEHPELGQISPAVFIPLAEETGVIREITAFVLEKACADCARWPDPICVSVNLSAKDLVPGVVDIVGQALATAGLAPHRLEIEVTETSLLDDKSAARDRIEELRSLGVRIALDDFGTGYSSLSYLHRLSLDKIKIDRSFILDLLDDRRSLELLKSIVEMSHRLDMAVTVEGVETFQQLSVLMAEVKPDLVQGFLFGAAVTSSGIEAMSSTTWQFGDNRDDASGSRPRRSSASVG
jgi:diguanylate cyclase (GGDEF)-like protein